MKINPDKLYFYLKLFFWCNIILFVLVFLFILRIKGPDFGTDTDSSVIFERYAIILTLIAIPGALKLFSVLINKKKDTSPDQFLKRYLQLYMFRTGVLDLVVIVNLVGFYIYESVNFVYLISIAILAICFSFPVKFTLSQDKNTEDTDININDVKSENKEEV